PGWPSDGVSNDFGASWHAMMFRVNVKEWAASRGIRYLTARRRYAAGTLPVPRTGSAGWSWPANHPAGNLGHRPDGWRTPGYGRPVRKPTWTGRSPGSAGGRAGSGWRCRGW